MFWSRNTDVTGLGTDQVLIISLLNPNVSLKLNYIYKHIQKTKFCPNLITDKRIIFTNLGTSGRVTAMTQMGSKSGQN